MASVDLGGKLWLNLVSDDSTWCVFDLNAIELDPAVTVRAAANASGGWRAVRTPGRQQVAKVTLGFCTDDEQAFLAAHQGDVLWFRALTGVRFAGFYTDSTFTPRPIGDSWSVPLTVQQISVSDLL